MLTRIFASRFEFSAEPLLGEAQSEIGHFLSHPEQFSGYSYFDGGDSVNVGGFVFHTGRVSRTCQ